MANSYPLSKHPSWFWGKGDLCLWHIVSWSLTRDQKQIQTTFYKGSCLQEIVMYSVHEIINHLIIVTATFSFWVYVNPTANLLSLCKSHCFFLNNNSCYYMQKHWKPTFIILIPNFINFIDFFSIYLQWWIKLWWLCGKDKE